MARKISPRQRANTTGGDAISKPTFEYTDALPRSDLKDIGHVTPTVVDQPRRSNTFSNTRQLHVQGGGFSSRKAKASPANNHNHNHNHAFDFQLSPSQDQNLKQNGLPVPRENDGAEEQMIGIALGSPGVPYILNQSNANPAMDFPVAASGRDSDELLQHESNKQSVRRKPSKWKKLGGLFKSNKNSSPQPPQPFYQVRVDEPPPSNRPQVDRSFSPEVAYQQHHGNHRTANNKELETSPPQRRKRAEIKPPEEPQGIGMAVCEDTATATTATTSPKSNPRVERQLEPIDESIMNSGPKEQNSSAPIQPDSLLEVEIPDAQMERYSVMFGSVLGKTQPSNPMDRRSRTLDTLEPLNEVCFISPLLSTLPTTKNPG